MMKVILLTAAVTILSGCTTTRFARPPEDKLTCAEEPGRPAGKGPAYTDANGIERRAVTDEENGEYLRDLRASGASCRQDVNWLRSWFDSLDKRRR